MTTLWNSKNNLFFILLAIISVFFYFSSEVVKEYSPNNRRAKSIYEKDLKHLKIASENVINLKSKDTVILKFEKAYNNKLVSKTNFIQSKKDIKIFGFNDNWHFWDTFGKIFCWFILVSFLLGWFLSRATKFIGIILLLSTGLSLAIFKMYWIFQPFQDVSKITYYIIALLSTILMTFAIHYINKTKKSKYDKLKSKNQELLKQREKLIIHTILNSKDENKKKEILDYLEKSMS